MIKINKLHSYEYVSRKFVLFYYYIFKHTYRLNIFSCFVKYHNKK